MSKAMVAAPRSNANEDPAGRQSALRPGARYTCTGGGGLSTGGTGIGLGGSSTGGRSGSRRIGGLPGGLGFPGCPPISSSASPVRSGSSGLLDQCSDKPQQDLMLGA